MDKRALAEQPLFVLILGGLTALTALSIDIILPGTGLIARELGAEAEAGAALVGVYLIAYGVGQLFWGMFSDAFGRKPAILLSLAGYLAASVACALASSLWGLVALRALQGLMGGAPVMARAIARDIGEGEAAARLFAVLMAVTSTAPMLAPIIGSALISLVGWRACFWALALMSALLAVLTYRFVVETVPERRPERFSLRFLGRATVYLMPKRAFLGGLLTSGLIFAGYVSTLSIGAVVTEVAYGLTPSAFAAIFAFGAIFVVSSSLAVRPLIPRYGIAGVARIMLISLVIAVAVQATFLLFSPSLPVFWSGVILYFIAFGFSMPITQAIAMQPAAEMAGFASSVLGAAQMAFGGLGAALAFAFFDGSHLAISGTMALCGGAAILAHWLLLRERPGAATATDR